MREIVLSEIEDSFESNQIILHFIITKMELQHYIQIFRKEDGNLFYDEFHYYLQVTEKEFDEIMQQLF